MATSSNVFRIELFRNHRLHTEQTIKLYRTEPNLGGVSGGTYALTKYVRDELQRDERSRSYFARGGSRHIDKVRRYCVFQFSYCYFLGKSFLERSAST